MWFVLGVVLMIVGVAFCLLGPIRLPGGRVLRARYAQVCGAILLSYFPLIFVLQPYTGEWDAEFRHMLNAALASCCLILVVFIVLKTTQAPRPLRRHTTAPLTDSPLFTDQSQAGEPPAGVKPSPARSGKDKNSFDFS